MNDTDDVVVWGHPEAPMHDVTPGTAPVAYGAQRLFILETMVAMFEHLGYRKIRARLPGRGKAIPDIFDTPMGPGRPDLLCAQNDKAATGIIVEVVLPSDLLDPVALDERLSIVTYAVRKSSFDFQLAFPAVKLKGGGTMTERMKRQMERYNCRVTRYWAL